MRTEQPLVREIGLVFQLNLESVYVNNEQLIFLKLKSSDFAIERSMKANTVPSKRKPIPATSVLNISSKLVTMK